MTEHVYVYVCDRCEWVTDGLNTYLAHKCDPGVAWLRAYQRAAAVGVVAPGESRWRALDAQRRLRAAAVAAAFRAGALGVVLVDAAE
jgi:hypothetical protein